MKKILIAVAISALLIFAGYFLFNRQSKSGSTQVLNKAVTPTLSKQNLKTFKSSTIMDFTIQVPSSYVVVEKMGSVKISNQNGEINIGQNATNYDNLNDFLNDDKNTRYNEIKKKEVLRISGLESVSGFIDNEKIYFIYSDYNVYLIYTKAFSLYSDLDQIARSFRYTP